MPQICLSTRSASGSIHSFFSPARIDGTVEGVKSCPSPRCWHKSFLSPSSLNESSCIQQNDLEQLILSQTHLAWQCPPGMATQTNDFRQRYYTSAFLGPTAKLAVGEGGRGISSTYGTLERNKGKSLFTLPQPAILRVHKFLSDFPVELPLLVLTRDNTSLVKILCYHVWAVSWLLLSCLEQYSYKNIFRPLPKWRWSIQLRRWM